MSSTTIKPGVMPRPISQRLRQLRARITRFVLIDGLGKLFAVIVLVFLADLFLDRVFKMDLAQRGIMLFVMAAIFLAVLFLRLVKPFTRHITDDALILQVESKNRELRESVISAAQFSRASEFEAQGYSQSMVDATIQHGSRLAEEVNFGNTIDGNAFARNIALLVMSVAGLVAIGWGVAESDFWRTWFNRNILLTNDQWPRKTILAIDGVQDGTLVLPRGEDHQQIVRVTETSSVTDVVVSIEFDDGHSRTTQKMRKNADLEHALVFRNLTSEFRFRALGGDDVTKWVQVRLVDPPGWSELNLAIHLPEYTGLDVQRLPPGGGPHAVLDGSSVTIQATANKQLSEASLKAGEQQWPLIQDESGNWKLSIPPADLVGGKYTFDLADESGLRSGRPATFTLKVKPDREPSVRGTLRGISGLVVPRARVPISYTAGDEFSITTMHLEHEWTGTGATSVPQRGSIDLRELDPDLEQWLGDAEIKSLAVLDLEPLDIPANVSLRLVVNAVDNNTLSGPGVGKSREFLLRVVTEDELRADLLRREIEQRKAFELIVSNQQKLVYELQSVSDLAEASEEPMDPDQTLDSLRDAQRRQKLIGTNVARIADRFEDFLYEVKNNRLDEAERDLENSQSIEERFNVRIITPIRGLDSEQIIHAAQRIEMSQRNVVYHANTSQKTVDRDALVTSIAEAIEKQNEVLAIMDRILSAMKDSETYQEIVNKVIEIKRSEERIRILSQEKRDEIGSGNVFDDEDDDSKKEDDEQDKEGGDDG